MTDALDLKAVHVSSTNDGDEYYEVGRFGVSAIRWGANMGHRPPLTTVRVFKDGALHSEHPFANVLGVYYFAPEARDDGN